MAKKKVPGTVRVRFSLSIGLQGKQQDVVEYDRDDVPPEGQEREDWLNEEWLDWSANYLDGCAKIEEQQE